MCHLLGSSSLGCKRDWIFRWTLLINPFGFCEKLCDGFLGQDLFACNDKLNTRDISGRECNPHFYRMQQSLFIFMFCVMKSPSSLSYQITANDLTFLTLQSRQMAVAHAL